jgi:L-threonylcarbamoyladenylate synthase
LALLKQVAHHQSAALFSKGQRRMSRHTIRLAADRAGIAAAAALLLQGQLVAFPTETVYGLGADATDEAAVAAIYAAKNRPGFNPLIAHYATAGAAFGDVMPTAFAERIAAAFWPGPLTLVLPRRPGCTVARIAGAGLDTQAVRVPAHPIAQRLLAGVGRPVAAPSANLSGRVSPTTARHVLDGLDGRIAAVIDGGACLVGLESTVIDLSGGRPILLRAGGVTIEALRRVTPEIMNAGPQDAAVVISPGQLLSHYAPDLPLRLNATEIGTREALLAFGAPLAGAALVFNLSPTGDLAEAAARLIAGLAVPKSGLGAAINDRLSRAAHR